MSHIEKAAAVGDLALYRLNDGFTFAVVTKVAADGACVRARRSQSVKTAKIMRGISFAVGSAGDLDCDVTEFVDATPDIFASAIEAQRAVVAWLSEHGAENSVAAKLLAKVKGIAPVAGLERVG
jgi:hypothetical protein